MTEEIKVPETRPAAKPPQATADDFMVYRNARPKEPFMLPSGKQGWVWGLTPTEKRAWYDSCVKVREPDGDERIDDAFADVKLIIRSVRDEAGTLLFKDIDLMRMIEWPPIILAPLTALCMKVSAVGGKADPEILKNFAVMFMSGSSFA
jgi:hypothetical protein